MEKITIKELFKYYCISILNCECEDPQYNGLNCFRADCTFTDPNTEELKYWNNDIIVYPKQNGFRINYFNLDILVPKYEWKMIVKECFSCVMVYVRYKGEDGKYVWKQYRYTDDCEGTEEERVKAYKENIDFYNSHPYIRKKVHYYNIHKNNILNNLIKDI